MPKGGLFSFVFLASILSGITAGYTKCLKIASDTKGIEAVKFFRPGVEIAFQKAGVCVDFVNMKAPDARRAIITGKIDGEFIRVNAYIDAMKNFVVPVPTPIVAGSGFIVTLSKTGFAPSGIKDILNKRIGIIAGFKWHEFLSRNIKTTKKAYKYNDLAMLLKQGEIDGFFTESLSLGRLYKVGILSKSDIYISRPVINLTGYLLLHKKHAGHIKQLDRSLKIVKAQGWFQIP